MPFLSHSIPWHTLASLFEYGDGSDPGPQHPELFVKRQPEQRKQLEYFARKFQETVREHSAIERKKYRTSTEYAERARKWVVSKKEDTVEKNTTLSEPDIAKDEMMREAARREGNTQLRKISNHHWSITSSERRLVFPQDFSATYMSYVPITSGGAYGREGLIEDFAHIETWIAFITRRAHSPTLTENESNRLWLDEKSCSDILRLLIIDASTTANKERRISMLEAIFLLAHHPQVGIDIFLNNGMSCCNINVGLTSLVERISTAFVYLNLVWASTADDPSSPLLKPCEHLQNYEASYYRNSRFESLLPRPAYMNTRSFSRMLDLALQEHGHVVEHVFFNPLLAPYTSGRRSRYMRLHNDAQMAGGLEEGDLRVERDVFEDLGGLKKAVKRMWMMLVYCDMLLGDVGGSVNWVFVVVDGIMELFGGTGEGGRLLGEMWEEFVSGELYGGFFVKGNTE